MEYLQLCTTTAYEFASSVLTPEAYAKKAKELGYQKIAVTDNTLRCYPVFDSACRKYGIDPIFGYRFSLQSSSFQPFSAYLYIQNETGYHHLLQILKSKEKIGTKLLSLYHEGLLLVIQTDSELYFQDYYLTKISPDIEAYRKIFGDDFAFGITLRSKEDQEEAPVFYDYCENHGYPVFPFPEVHYESKKDGNTYRLFQASMKKEPYQEKEEEPYFLLSPMALEALYRKEDMERLAKYADRFDFTLLKKRGEILPIENAEEKLREKAEEGLRFRKKEGKEEYIKRLDYELSIIQQMNFSSYFLIVEDYVRFAKENDIKVGPGRGSAGGSLVSYLLSITDIDPIQYDLSFERFLNPKRKTMPDIDIDFEDTKRNEVVRYLENRYGEERVSTIRTYVTLKPKSALNLIGPALGVQENRIKKITSLIKDSALTFEEAEDNSWKGRKLKELLSDPYYQDIVNKAKPLLSLPVNTSFHAPGIILSKDEIAKECPRENGEYGTVEFEYPYMEEMGYLKVDILPLSTLSFLRDIENRILASGEKILPLQTVLEDKKTFDLLNRKHLGCIFQLDATEGMRNVIDEIKPKTFSDIPAILALYRPGPIDYIPTYAKRKNGLEKIVYPDSRLEPVLKETYGIMVYQEQVMKSLMVLASFSPEDADLFRRAISKKNIAKMKLYYDQFIQGCGENGISEEKAKDIFRDIEKFANYGFNKSHAYSYAFLTYQLLYYKANYPQAFYQSAFSLHSLSSSVGLRMMKELKEDGYHFHVPDINHSKKNELSFLEKEIYLPFSMIGGAENTLIDAIEKEREDSSFSSFYQLLLRLKKRGLLSESRSFLPLIEAGVFDSFSYSRESLINHLDQYLDFANLSFEENLIPDLDRKEENPGLMLLKEKSHLGIILSRKLSAISKKEGYQTYLISDLGMFDKDHSLTVENEIGKYFVTLKGNFSPHKGEFIYLDAEKPRYSKWLYPKRILLK